MDSSNFQEAFSSSSLCATNGKQNVEKIDLKRHCYSPPTRRQNWSLPESIIYYIGKNPKSPELYQKLIRSCKYFFAINPIIVCSDLICDDKNDIKFEVERDGNKKSIKFNNNKSTKLWITDIIRIGCDHSDDDDVVSSIISNIYKSDAKSICLLSQKISWNNFSFLASMVGHIGFDKSTVMNENGLAVAPLEKVIGVSPNVKNIYINLNDNDASISSDTVKNLLQLSHFHAVDEFRLTNIPESFDIETFFTYLKKNNHTDFVLIFSQSISDHLYNRIEEIIDEILSTKNRNYKCPFIGAVGIEEEKLKKLFIAYAPYKK